MAAVSLSISIVLIAAPASWAARSIHEFLDQKIADMDVRESTLFDTLVTIRQKNTDSVVFGFEDNRDPSKASVVLHSGNVRTLLSVLREAYPAYEFKVSAPGLINVCPARSYRGSQILDVHLAHFQAYGKRTVSDVISRLPNEVPELRNLLFPGKSGTLGASTEGGMEPTLNFAVDDVTVRQLLNKLSLYSLHLHSERDDRKQPLPVSWRYRFSTTDDGRPVPEFSTF